MKQNTHPAYTVMTLTCSNCNAEFTIGTTAPKGFSVALCSQCHPAYTGTQNVIDTANRVSKFMDRQKKFEAMKTEKSETAVKTAKAAKVIKATKK